MPLTIQIVSDLHLEFWQHKNKFNFLKPNAPYLALLGDTCCVASDADFNTFKRFINEYINKYKMIIIVAGNHEYYNSHPIKKNHIPVTINQCNIKLRNLCKSNNKLCFLNNNTLTITEEKQKYMIVGSVLWTLIPQEKKNTIESNMNDYNYIYTEDKKTKKIRLININDINKLHMINRRYISKQLNIAKKNNYKVIVLTHHKPYRSAGFHENDHGYAYESDMSNLFKRPLIMWCYGHTHIKDNSNIKNIKFISNPKGYPYQQTLFDNSFIISV